MTRWALVLASGLALSACVASTPPAPTRPAGPVTLTPVDGPGLMRLIRARKAPLTLVNVWATWCAPCVAELPDVLATAREYAPKGLALVLISTDAPAAQPEARALLESLQAPLPTYVKEGSDEAFITALHPEWNGTLPATFLYAPDGACVGYFEGELDRDALHEILSAAEWSAAPEESP